MLTSQTDTTSQFKLDQLTQQFDNLPVAHLSSANLTKRLYITSLINKANLLSVRHKTLLLDNVMLKIEHALSELETALRQQQQKGQEQLTIIEEEYDYVFEKAQSLLEAQSYKELARLFKAVKQKKYTRSFSELVDEMSNAELDISYSGLAEKEGKKTNQTQLKSFQQYQVMFEKMALSRLLSRVMKEIPENAGPLNPERLVIRSFKVLQDISPDYLSRLLAYYESLLTLQLLNNADR